MSALIALKNITVTFEQKTVLDNISLTVERGKITTLIGPNGAGKSTLVKVMLGLQRQFKGDIEKSPKLRIGYVPQKLKLNDTLPLTVERFLKLAGRYSTQERQQSLQLVGAQPLLKSNMHTLSGGEMQRVLLARALLQRPDILVLDEPAQGVDVQGQIDLYALINNLRHRFNCAVFMVSHDLHLVMAQTDEVICLQHHVCCSGSPEDITQHPNYLKMFGNQARDTLAVYQHHHHHHHDLAGEAVSDDVEQCHNQSCSHHTH